MKALTSADDAHIQTGVGGLFLLVTWIGMKKDAWAVGAICARRRRFRNDLA